MRRQKTSRQPDDLLSASEIACFAYCAESWRLEYGLGLDAGNHKEKVAGIRHHARKSVAERVTGGAIALGRFLAVLAAVALHLLLWSWL
jgi:hypothetical protein